ncbi:hypothetical protein AAG906_022813 [Vitis piasezkii]
MAVQLVGGAFLSASLQVLLDRLASSEVLNFIRGQKLSDSVLSKFKIKLLIVDKVLDHAENLDLLQQKLKESLGDKKFLLVLDDVWEKCRSEWEGLRIPLLAAGEGSKVVVTTRNPNVGKIMRADHTHPLEGLSEAHCWEWEQILESEIWGLQDHEILPSLLLSYQDLPLHLKKCLAYCSIFPKDHEFDKDTLILLWMAGLLQFSKGNDIVGKVDDKVQEISENTRHSLNFISNFDGMVMVKRDALRANMKDKRHLDELDLKWSNGDTNDVIQSGILNNLQPHPNLKQLTIDGYPGKLPEELPSLKKLETDGCWRLLVASLQVPAIRELEMVGFGELQLKMPASGFAALQTSHVENPHFPMQDLVIEDCFFQTVGQRFLLPELFRCHHPALEELKIGSHTLRILSSFTFALSFSLAIFPGLIQFDIDALNGLESLSISISEGEPLPFVG